MKVSINNAMTFQPLLQFSLILLVSLTFQQSSFAQKKVNLSGGLALGYSPTLIYEETSSRAHEGKGNTFSIFGELIIQQRFIGRLQMVNLITSTYSGDFANQLKSGRSFTGSLGIILGKKESRVRLPVMASAGAGLVSYDDFSDGGSQFGITAGPQLRLTKNLFILAELRYLKGFKSSEESGPVSQTDFLLGVKISI